MRKLVSRMTMLAVLCTCLAAPARPWAAAQGSSSDSARPQSAGEAHWPMGEGEDLGGEVSEAAPAGMGEEGLARLVKDINTSPAPSQPSNLTEVGGTLFFTASAPGVGSELWKSDGTEEGTVLVKDINPGIGESSPLSPTDVGGTLFFTADVPGIGRELWKSDGTAEGTVLVQDIFPGSGDSSPQNMTAVGGTLFFAAFEPTTGRELWALDL